MFFRRFLPLRQSYLLRRFRAAVNEARWEASSEVAERLLDLEPSTDTYAALLRPFDRMTSPAGRLRLYDFLGSLERDAGASHRPWRLLLRVALLDRLGWYPEALHLSAQFETLPERYGWMRHARAMILLNQQLYDEASRELEATLRAAPAFWKARGQLAECTLCQGRESDAFALMDQCVDQLAAAGRFAEHQEALTWRGEFRLWLGQYDAALTDLAAGMASSFSYALIWGGAAHLLRGEQDRALALLDRAVKAVPGDAEAYLWRGEAHERVGDAASAIRDFDRTVSLTGMSVWPCIGRALAKARIGDTAATIADLTAVPSRIRALFVKARLI